MELSTHSALTLFSNHAGDGCSTLNLLIQLRALLINSEPEMRREAIKDTEYTEDELRGMARHRCAVYVGEKVDDFLSVPLHLRAGNANSYRNCVETGMNWWREFGGSNSDADAEVISGHVQRLNQALPESVRPLPTPNDAQEEPAAA